MPMAMTTLKNFSVIKIGDTYQLVIGYNLMNTPLHIEGDDLGLNGGLSPHAMATDNKMWTCCIVWADVPMRSDSP